MSVCAHTLQNTHFFSHLHIHTYITENRKFSCNWTRNRNTILHAHIPNSMKTRTKITNLSPTPPQSISKKRKAENICSTSQIVSEQIVLLQFSMRQGSSLFSPSIWYILFPSGTCGISQGGCMHTQAHEHPQPCEVVEPLPTTKSRKILGDGVSYATEMQGRGTQNWFRQLERGLQFAALGQGTSILTHQDNRISRNLSWDKGMKILEMASLSHLASLASIGKVRNKSPWQLTWCWLSGAEALTSTRSAKWPESEESLSIHCVMPMTFCPGKSNCFGQVLPPLRSQVSWLWTGILPSYIALRLTL